MVSNTQEPHQYHLFIWSSAQCGCIVGGLECNPSLPVCLVLSEVHSYWVGVWFILWFPSNLWPFELYSRVRLSLWEPVLWCPSVLRQAQLSLRLQGWGSCQDPQGEPCCGRWQDPENIGLRTIHTETRVWCRTLDMNTGTSGKRMSFLKSQPWERTEILPVGEMHERSLFCYVYYFFPSLLIFCVYIKKTYFKRAAHRRVCSAEPISIWTFYHNWIWPLSCLATLLPNSRQLFFSKVMCTCSIPTSSVESPFLRSVPISVSRVSCPIGMTISQNAGGLLSPRLWPAYLTAAGHVSPHLNVHVKLFPNRLPLQSHYFQRKGLPLTFLKQSLGTFSVWSPARRGPSLWSL